MTGRQDTPRPRGRSRPLLASAVGALGLSILVVPLSGMTTADPPDEAAAAATSGARAASPRATSDGTRHIRNTQVPGARVVHAAAEEYGHPYRYAANGPVAFDCSGLTEHVYEQFGIRLPHNSAAQYRAVDHVSKSNMRIGDLVFFYDDDGIYHVGIYAGEKQMWAAGQPGEIVRKHDIWTHRFVVGRP